MPEGERPAGVDRAELLREAADTAHLAGEHERAVALGRSAVELWEAAGEPTGLALAHERLGNYLTDSGAMEAGLEELREALRLMPAEPPSAERARVLHAEAQQQMVMSAHGGGYRESCEEAIRIAAAVGARDVEARRRITLGVALYLMNEDGAAIDQVRDGLRIAEEVGLVEELWRAYLNLGTCSTAPGRSRRPSRSRSRGARSPPGWACRPTAPCWPARPATA